MLVLQASGPALGEVESGTVTLEDGEALFVAFDSEGGNDLWVEYQVRVLEGPPVNVWVLDEDGLTEFFDDNASVFSYHSDESVRETMSTDEAFYWYDTGTYYVVVDNDFNDAEGQSVTVEFTVSWEEVDIDETLFIAIGIIVAVVVALIIVVMFVVMMRKVQGAIEAQKAEEAPAMEGDTLDDGRPRPPEPYPEWVVAGSMRGMEDDDATGWDPSRDEPED